MLQQAWDEQKAIGRDQILKVRLSEKWERAQEMYYYHNAITQESKLYSKQSWTIKTIQSLYEYVLGLWNECCDALHGATVKENNEKKRQKIREQVLSVYGGK